MADWYVSSVAWAALPQFAISTAYTIGQIIRGLAAPAFTAQHAFRCTTAGTSGGSEPAWSATNNATTVSGTATFTTVTGQSAYGWSAASGNLYQITSAVSSRFTAGDRAFLSSDHAESNTTNTSYPLSTSHDWSGIRVISVSRAGSVPPVAADITAGASITYAGTGTLSLDPYQPLFWQGISFTLGGSATTFFLGSSGVKVHYFKDCSFIFTTSTTTATMTTNTTYRVVFDNTSVKFNAAAQQIRASSYPLNLDWINTATPLGGGTVPTTLFLSTQAAFNANLRGVDLSALTTTLAAINAGVDMGQKFLLDSCKIASGVVRLSATSLGISSAATAEVELVNCFDGTSIISERHTAAGDVTWETSITLSGGAQDDVGPYSLKMVSSSRADPWANTLDSFWFDVENTLTSGTRTATVEIMSSTALNNNEVRLIVYAETTTGSSLVAVADSLATILTPTAALPSSSVTWNNPPGTPQKQYLRASFAPRQAGRLRGQVRLGKASATVYVNPQMTVA